MHQSNKWLGHPIEESTPPIHYPPPIPPRFSMMSDNENVERA